MRRVRKEVSSGTWGISCSSRGDDNENYILLWLGSVVYTYHFDWFFLSPYEYVWKYDDKTHHMIAAKQIGFTINLGPYDGYISMKYGADKDFLMSNSEGANIKHIPTLHKMWSIPWLHKTFRQHALLNMDGSTFYIMRNRHYTDFVEPSSWDFPDHERMQYVFADGFDGEIITATVQRESRTWTHGVSWMKWLKYFTKPSISDSLSFNFNHEVGNRKGSWKGGTLGHGVDVNEGESVDDAVIRYCREQGHKFIDFETQDNGQRIYKNIVDEPRQMEENTNMAKSEGQGSVL